MEYLQDTKELLLLLPATRGLDTGAIVAGLYRNKDDKIRLRQITKRCEVLPPIIIAKDYNGVFDRRASEKSGNGSGNLKRK
jgi:hypothetical protein